MAGVAMVVAVWTCSGDGVMVGTAMTGGKGDGGDGDSGGGDGDSVWGVKSGDGDEHYHLHPLALLHS